MTSDKLILEVVHKVKTEIALLEKELSRAKIVDLAEHARLQGHIDGLDKALGIIDVVLIGDDN